MSTPAIGSRPSRTTTNYAIRVPGDADAADLYVLLGELADKVDSTLAQVIQDIRSGGGANAGLAQTYLHLGT